jgi:ATP-binding cassette subfamily B protein/subfamily B ATP-binding cassette protein MsbA
VTPPWLSLSYRYARLQAAPFAIVLGLMLLEIVFTVLTPWPLKLIVDNVLPGQTLPDAAAWIGLLPGADDPHGLLGWLAVATLLLFAGRQAALMIKGYVQAGAATRIKLDLAKDLLDVLQKLSLRFHHAHKAGDLVRRVVNDTDFVRLLIVGVVLPAMTSALTLLVMFGVMWVINPTLSLLALLAALPMPFLMRWLAPRLSQRSFEQYEAEGELMAVAEQSISSLPMVQAFGGEAGEEARFRGGSRRAIRAYLRVTRTQLQYAVAIGSMTALGTAALMVLGSLQVEAANLSIGSLLVFLAYLAASYQPLETLANLSTAYANSEGQARRVIQVFDAEDEVPERSTACPFVRQSGRQGIGVSFENVTFGYEPGRPVLKDIDLHVQAGETVALVGNTGAGKSTLASLVPRFFDPWEGRVLLDGTDARDLQLRSLRQQVALVLQEPFLLPLSVAENIAYGRPDASREEIVAAAVAANADEFIRHLPDGYDTVIGERGATLSGGQRQRLGIARALLKDAPILILDEPTSALDTKTEALILEALERLMANRTTFIIAHRLSTIRNTDRVVVLKGGTIAEQGSEAQLLTLGGAYQHLAASQMQRVAR